MKKQETPKTEVKSAAKPKVNHYRGSELEALLKAAKITPAELCEKFDFCRATIYQWQGKPPAYAVAFLTERKNRLDLEESLAKLREHYRFAKENGL